jgi:hypothetical protein
MTGWSKPLTILAVTLALLTHGTALHAEPIHLAQNQEDRSYLPPWQGEEDAPTPDEQVFGNPDDDTADEGRGARDNPEPPRNNSQAYEPQRSGEDYGEAPPRGTGRYDDPRDEPLFDDRAYDDPRYDQER